MIETYTFSFTVSVYPSPLSLLHRLILTQYSSLPDGGFVPEMSLGLDFDKLTLDGKSCKETRQLKIPPMPTVRDVKEQLKVWVFKLGPDGTHLQYRIENC
jgi:hypothetical protein